MSALETAPSRTPKRTDGYAPIRDYAVIGNKRTAALVALDGSIDWLCLPGLSSPSAFGNLLEPGAGSIALAPTEPFTAHRRYLPDTNVLETTFTTPSGTVSVTDAMSWPAAHTLVFNQVIRRVDGLAGRVPMAWHVRPRFAYGTARGEVDRRAGAPLIVHGPDTVAVEAFEIGAATCAQDGVEGAFDAVEGATGVLAISAFRDEPLTFSTAEELLSRLDMTVERWRTRMRRCSCDGPWADAVRRSALALDLLIESQTGAIAAAATMGLPERIGGPRNFDYRYAWVRDSNLTLEAMQRLGFGDEVHTSLGWILRTVRRTRPRLRPMYELDGAPRLPDTTSSLRGYRDSRPVTLGNGAQDQLQLGNFGDVLDMTWKYVDGGNALARADAVELAAVADHVCRIWELPDASIWELGDAKQYTQGKLACWLALEHARALADRGELPTATAPRWREEAERIADYIERRCWSEEAGAYARTADSDELDASVLLASRGSFFERQPERLSATIDAVCERLGAGGPLVYRYSGMEGREGAFVACSFWVVEALARVGRVDEAHDRMDAMVAMVSDVGLLSEEIDPATGEFLGNLPQALSHLALVNAAYVLQDIA